MCPCMNLRASLFALAADTFAHTPYTWAFRAVEDADSDPPVVRLHIQVRAAAPDRQTDEGVYREHHFGCATCCLVCCHEPD